jgi:hypothetical protein
MVTTLYSGEPGRKSRRLPRRIMKPYKNIRLQGWPDKADIRDEGRPSRFGKLHGNTRRRARRIMAKINRAKTKANYQEAE